MRIAKEVISKGANELWSIAYENRTGTSTTVLEHLSYLIYSKMISNDKEKLESSWNHLLKLLNQREPEYAVDFYHDDFLRDNLYIFKDSNFMVTNMPFRGNVFKKIVFFLEDFFNTYSERECFVHFFDSLLLKVPSKELGILITPTLVAKFMAKLLLYQTDYNVSNFSLCDPACGIGTLLNSTIEELGIEKGVKKNHMYDENFKFLGYELNTIISRIAQLSMMFRNQTFVKVHNDDSLSLSKKHHKKYDYIICNPPIIKKNDYISPSTWYSIGGDYPNIKTRSYKFIELSLSLLKDNGRCALIVPEGILSSKARDVVEFRSELLNRFEIEGIISLPAGIFKETSIKTSILIISNKVDIKRKKIWYYEFDQKPEFLRNEEQVWDNLFKSWGDFLNDGEVNTDNDYIWITSHSEIANNEFQLAASVYRVRRYEEKVYSDPNQILNELKELDQQINKDMEELFQMHYKEQTTLSSIQPKTNEFATMHAETHLSTVKNTLWDHLSLMQQVLLDVYMESDCPLAIHEAAKLVNDTLTPSKKLGVQEATQITKLFEALGLLESVSSGAIFYPKQSANESNRVVNFQDSVTILLWKKAEQLRRN